MRVAALYDVHGNLPALEAVLDELEADLVVIGGDIAPGPKVGEVLDALRSLDVPTRWVMGNGDREELGPDQLAGFELTVEVDVDGLGSVLFCHGSPRSD